MDGSVGVSRHSGLTSECQKSHIPKVKSSLSVCEGMMALRFGVSLRAIIPFPSDLGKVILLLCTSVFAEVHAQKPWVQTVNVMSQTLAVGLIAVLLELVSRLGLRPDS